VSRSPEDSFAALSEIIPHLARLKQPERTWLVRWLKDHPEPPPGYAEYAGGNEPMQPEHLPPLAPREPKP
jgi:hypothetical protein